MKDSSPLDIGLIGCGSIFQMVYGPLLQSMKLQVRVSAVCDLHAATAQAAANRFPGARAYTDAGKLFREESPDAVMVLTSEVANAPMTLQALEARVPVYLEKPPATGASEWSALLESEAATNIPIFTAFNRRHTPLFQGWKPPVPSRKVWGALVRKRRAPATFPYTAVHLLDSAQWFCQSRIAEAHTSSEEKGGVARWRIRGQMENGTACDFTFIPNGSEHQEFLVFETENEAWTLHFPNPEGTLYPHGRILFRRSGHREESFATGKQSDRLEAMGYAPCLREFLKHLEHGTKSAHRLARCGGTIRILEAMLAKTAKSTPQRMPWSAGSY